MNQLLFSIVIPVYNVEGYLSQCVESVEKQKFGSCELILVDDGSTDSSGKICDQLAHVKCLSAACGLSSSFHQLIRQRLIAPSTSGTCRRTCISLRM